MFLFFRFHAFPFPARGGSCGFPLLGNMCWPLVTKALGKSLSNFSANHRHLFLITNKRKSHDYYHQIEETKFPPDKRRQDESPKNRPLTTTSFFYHNHNGVREVSFESGEESLSSLSLQSLIEMRRCPKLHLRVIPPAVRTRPQGGIARSCAEYATCETSP